MADYELNVKLSLDIAKRLREIGQNNLGQKICGVLIGDSEYDAIVDLRLVDDLETDRFDVADLYAPDQKQVRQILGEIYDRGRKPAGFFLTRTRNHKNVVWTKRDDLIRNLSRLTTLIIPNDPDAPNEPLYALTAVGGEKTDDGYTLVKAKLDILHPRHPLNRWEQPLGFTLETRERLRPDYRSRLEGLYIIGITGQGKSTLIENLVTNDMQSGHGVAVLDPHGELVENILRSVPKSRAGDVVLLDAGDTDYPFGLNFFDVQDKDQIDLVAGQFVQTLEKVWQARDGAWGPLLADLLENIAYTMLSNDGYSLYEIPRLLTDQEFRSALIRDLDNPIVADYWRYEYDQMTRRQQLDERQSTMRRVRSLLRRSAIRNIVSQTGTSFNFRELLDTRSIVLVKLPVGLLQDDGVDLLGSIIVSQLLTAALNRQDNDPFFIYADEFHRFATRDFATLVAEARKYGIATTMAHQYRDQLHEGVQSAPLAVANIVSFRVSGGRDAEEIAKQMNIVPKPTRKRYEPVMEIFEGQLTQKSEWEDRSYLRSSVDRRTGNTEHEMVDREHARTVYQEVDDTPQTYADAAAELANSLTNLPKYRAYVRSTINGEVHEALVETPPPPKPVLDEDQVAEIRERSRIEYGRPKSEVEEQFKLRERLPPPIDVEMSEEPPPRRRKIVSRQRVR